ncbi:putative SET and MYND domain-containing protein 1 isoform X2 [Trypanosoma theileri]|uniref:Putative SET and MYND domain-containing protein 1 isoform X2 n=1 Tax=Trypanosoma theileri TaxID=67003 RepID=A0A1X0P546_9TRYP|nr:putative SET and MYND domain-containing protein 1 isoform X2 [Trypanosoma theileri]ORC91958.1 putative SET and MYND domain-containing protein 1 isoform X2 [Trypanosoma theileri]
MSYSQNMSLEQHLKDERTAYTTLTLLNIQISALLERFYREWLALDYKRRQIVEELEYHSLAIREHRRRLELALFPPEFKAWISAAIPEIETTPIEYETENKYIYEPFSDISCSNPPAVGKDRVVFEDVISRQVVRWCDENSSTYKERPAPSRLSRVAPQPELLLRHCFLPYRETETNAPRRRAVGNDVLIMQSPEPSVGRVLVSMHMVRRGETIMVETPFFTSPITKSEADDETLLPPVIRETMTVVEKQSAVFATQGWDTRLLRPFYHWLTEIVFGEKSDDFIGRWDELGCPVEDVDPVVLSKLAELAHFFWLSLPSSISSSLGNEERLLNFFVTLLTNGMSYGGLITNDNNNNNNNNDNGSVHLGGLEQGIAVFGGLSMIEHSCNPNAVVVFRQGCTPESVLFAELRATRTIAIGERITIAYLPTFLSRDERQKRLQRKFFFFCACEHCTNGLDTTRLMFILGEKYESGRRRVVKKMFCPRGKGSSWCLLLLHPQSSQSLEKVEKSYRFDDNCVLDAIHDEEGFRKEVDAVDLTGNGAIEGETLTVAKVVMKEVKRLKDILLGEADTLISPFHYLYLLRSIQLAVFSRSRISELDIVTRELLSSFLCELLIELIEVTFSIPEWFITELLLCEIREGVLTVDLRERLLDNQSNNNNNNNNHKSANTLLWQEKIVVEPLFEQHATLVISLLEHYAILCGEFAKETKAMNAWTACVLLLRYGLCQHGSERCLRAQLKALQLCKEKD